MQIRVQNKGKRVWKSRYNGEVSLANPPRPRGATRGRSWTPSPITSFSIHRWTFHLSQATWALRDLCAWPNKAIAPPLSPCWPLGHGVTLGGLPNSFKRLQTFWKHLGKIPKKLKLFSEPWKQLPIYINLYLRTIPELLVTSPIPSETSNNIWLPTYISQYYSSVTEC